MSSVCYLLFGPWPKGSARGKIPRKEEISLDTLNLEAIFITNAIGAAIALNTLHASHYARHKRALDDALFTLLLWVTFAACIIEPITFFVDGRSHPLFIACSLIANTSLFLFSSVMSFIWILYVDYKLYQNKERFRRIAIPGGIFCLCVWMIVLTNPVHGLVFTLQEGCIYTRGVMGTALFLVPPLYSLFSVADTYHYRRKVHGTHFFPIWSFILPMYGGVLLQTLLYGISLAWCTTSIGLSFLYMALQNEIAFQDPLTRLLNRYYLSIYFNSSSQYQKTGLGGLMIDVDHFKAINDTYGHAVGDAALCEVADLLRNCGQKNSLPFRFAGDEFIILMETEKEEDLLQLKETILKATEEANQKKERPYHLSLSIGTCLYRKEEDSPDAFLHLLDQAMYQEKELHHREKK